MKINVAAAQYPITEHKDFDAWKQHVEDWVSRAAKQGAQLLLFPEYGSMELESIFPKEVRENVREQIRQLQSLREAFCSVFADLAKKYAVVIVAPSFPVLEEGNFVNRAYVFSEKGLVGYQDKFFITRFEGEEWGIKSAPKVLTLFEAPWGSFGIQICYDVEFNLGAKLLSEAGACLILAPSCTEARRGATRVHLGARARALETQTYTAVSQTVGYEPAAPAVEENFGYAAFYCSPVLDMPEDGIINENPTYKEGWLLEELDLSTIKEIRNDARVFNFQDHQRFYSDFENEEITLIRKKV